MTADDVQAAAGVAGVVVTAIGFVFVSRQINLARRAAIAQANVALGEQSLTILSFIAANPCTYPYLYENKPFVAGDANVVTVQCVCEMLANYCDLTVGVLPDLEPAVALRWKNFVVDTVRGSPAMQQYLRSRYSWYSPQLFSLLESDGINIY